MRDLNDNRFAKYRNLQAEQSNVVFVGSQPDWSKNGFFEFPTPYATENCNVLAIIATTSSGWEHVSVSRPDRCPIWQEMELIKRVFFKEDECAMQLHPPLDEYVDGSIPGGRAMNTLHLWRPLKRDIPCPPRRLVGCKTVEEYKALVQAAGLTTKLTNGGKTA